MARCRTFYASCVYIIHLVWIQTRTISNNKKKYFVLFFQEITKAERTILQDDLQQRPFVYGMLAGFQFDDVSTLAGPGSVERLR